MQTTTEAPTRRKAGVLLPVENLDERMSLARKSELFVRDANGTWHAASPAEVVAEPDTRYYKRAPKNAD